LLGGPLVNRASLLRAIRLALLATSTASTMGCGGRAIEVQGPNNDDGGTQPRPDASDDGGFITQPGGCTVKRSPPSPCGFDVTIAGDPAACGLPIGGGRVDPTTGGPREVDPTTCANLCGNDVNGQPVQHCYFQVAGSSSLLCVLGCSGRRPQNLTERRIAFLSPAAECFSHAAHLEAASVDAFRILHDELVAHGAPQALCRAALRAARDEVRHAAIVGRLALRFGGGVEAPVVPRGGLRDRFALALENAIEGCVRETWGALQTAWQARSARSANVRAAYRSIARDEAMHALLGWQVAEWAESKLTRAQRLAVRRARERAFEELFEALSVEPPEILVVDAGLPRANEAVLLARALFREIADDPFIPEVKTKGSADRR
jgi:hypothetical protein